jgi:hypothetical protein
VNKSNEYRFTFPQNLPECKRQVRIRIIIISLCYYKLVLFTKLGLWIDKQNICWFYSGCGIEVNYLRYNNTYTSFLEGLLLISKLRRILYLFLIFIIEYGVLASYGLRHLSRQSLVEIVFLLMFLFASSNVSTSFSIPKNCLFILRAAIPVVPVPIIGSNTI